VSPRARYRRARSLARLGHRPPLPLTRRPAAPTPPPHPRALYPLPRGLLETQDRAEQEQGLAPLGRLLQEAAAAYYALKAARIRQRAVDAAAALGACPPEVAVATAFKVGRRCGRQRGRG
jgi:hypothetical protein